MNANELPFETDRFDSAYLLITESGSRYVVGLDCAGGWWFGGANIPNPGSCALPLQLWPIREPTPWPPALGSPITMMALPDLARDDPERVPGGGKVTSPISVIRRLIPAAVTSSEASQ